MQRLQHRSQRGVARNENGLVCGRTVGSITVASAVGVEASIVEAVFEVIAAVAFAILYSVVERLNVARNAFTYGPSC